MASPSVLKRHFRDFKGLNQAASDLDREEMYAETATNIRQLRRGDVTKREGSVPQGYLEADMGFGMHVADLNKSVKIQSTGYAFGATAGASARSGATSSWSNPTNVTADDSSYATNSTTLSTNDDTAWLYTRNFSLSVPDTARVVGVEIRFQVSVTSGTPTASFYGALTTNSGSSFGPETLLSVDATTSEVGYVIGGKANLFGSNNLSPTVVNAATFGVGVYLVNSTAGSFTYEIDTLEVQVYYVDGESDSEELLSIGNSLCRQKTGTITITNSSGDIGTFALVPTASGYQVTLQEGGVAVSGWPKTYDTGTSFDNIGQLYTDINAESGWSMTATPIARLNDSAPYGTQVTVDASPMTFQAGDMVGFRNDNNERVDWRYIHSISGGVALNLDAEVFGVLASTDWIGLGAEPISSIEQKSVTLIANGSSITLEVPYMEGVPNIANTQLLIDQYSLNNSFVDNVFLDPSHTNTPDFRNFSFVNLRSNAYFAVPFFKAVGLDRNVISGEEELEAQNTGLWKYDGLQTHLAGLPEIPKASSPLSSTTGGSMTSSVDYKYRFQFTYQDANGNFIDGPLTDEYSVTMGGSDTAVNVAFNFNLDETLFPTRHADISSATANTNVATVSSGHGLIPGLTVRFWDSDNSKFVTRQVIDTTRTTVTFDGETVGVTNSGLADLTSISQLRVTVWRTEADGTVFYFNEDIPIAISSGGIVYGDKKADSDLGESLIEPDRFPDLFPKLSYLCTHQGLLVGSGNPDDPEVVYFGDALNPESSPSSTSNFRVPGGDTARVTAIASDNDDMLAVFKRNSYFNIVGDLDSLSFQRLTVSEFDYGCPAHHGIVKVNDTLIFPSETGFKAIQGGALASDFQDRFLIDFSNNYYKQEIGHEIDGTEDDKLVVRRAVATYDPETKQYICYIPKEDGIPGIDGTLEPEAASPIYVYNVQKDSWYKWSLPQQNNMAGGLVVFKDNLWWQARTYNSGIYGQVHKRRNSGLGYDYYDDITAVSMTLRMTWDSLDFPAAWFKPLFLKVYRFEPTGLSSIVSPIAFELGVNEYRNYDESTKYTQATRTFSTTHKERRFKFKSGRANAISLEFTQANAEEAGAISGYEYQVAIPYDTQRLQTRGESNS